MERAENISLAIIKSLMPIILEAIEKLKEKEINPIKRSDVMQEIKKNGVADLEIYQFADEIMNHLFRIKVAFKLDRVVAILETRELLNLLERVGGFREKYNAEIGVLTDGAKKDWRNWRKKSLDERKEIIRELAENLKRKIQHQHEEIRSKIAERRKKK